MKSLLSRCGVILAGFISIAAIATSAQADYNGPTEFTPLLAVGGCNIGTDALCVSGTTTISGRVTANGSITYGGAISKNNPGTTGFSLIQTAANLTDSGSTGTTAVLYGNLFGGNTILATNTKTFTNEYGSYFKADIAGAGATFSNSYALGADNLAIGASQTFTVSSSGAVQMSGLLSSNSDIIAGATHFLAWNSRSEMSSPTNGKILLQNAAGTGFTSLQLGGTTSSFGALQTNGTETDSELADGSGPAGLGATYIRFSGNAPTITGTGTPVCASTGTGCTNSAGDVTAGASATSVVITFNGTFGTGIPTCVVQSHTQLVAFSYVVTATAITITQTATTGNTISYECNPH